MQTKPQPYERNYNMNKPLNDLYKGVALDIAELVTEKQKSYGDSFGKSGEILRILYPNGIAPEQLADALTITLPHRNQEGRLRRVSLARCDGLRASVRCSRPRHPKRERGGL